MAALDLLPLPSLILGHDGMALQANAAWADISLAPPDEARGTGWLRVVEPAVRNELRARLRAAAADATAGSAHCWLEGASQPRLSRWWWQPGPVDQLIACVADLSARVQEDVRPLAAALTARSADGQAAGWHTSAGTYIAGGDVLDEIVRRLFGTGLQLQRVLAGVDGHTAAMLDQVVAGLDDLIRDVRVAALGAPRPVGVP